MLNRNQQFGQKSEGSAAGYLKKNGYTILERNYRTRFGEIDIIAQDKDTVVFVEVKAKTTYRFGHPKGAVTLKKQRKISMSALYYLKSTGQRDVKARFDVVSVIKTPNGTTIELIKNAFDLAY